MNCEKCRRTLYSNRSPLCIPCAAAATLEAEFKAPWGDETLRYLAGDIAVSAARHVRGLRVSSNKVQPGATAKSAASRPTSSRKRTRTPRRRSPGRDRRDTKVRGRSPRRSGQCRRDPEPRREGLPAEVKAGGEPPRERRRTISPSSYTSSAAAEAKRRQEESREARVERRSPQPKAEDREYRRRSRDRGKSVNERPNVNPQVIDFQDPAFQAKIKAEYLQGLEDQKKSARISLEEGPGGKDKQLLPPNLLKVPGPSQEREKESKSKRRQQRWT